MFLLNDILLFSPLLLYSAVRVFLLLKGALTRVAFVAGFVIVLAGFPLAETLSRQAASGVMRQVTLAGWYALPLLLYFMLVVVPADLVIGLARLARVLSRATVASPRFRRARLGVYLLGPVLIVGLGVWNFHTLRIRHFGISVPRGASAVDHLRVVFAADLHLSERTARGFMTRFVDKVNAQEPDIVLLGGDTIEGGQRPDNLAFWEGRFHRLRPKYGVYAVPGNHERYARGPLDFFEKAGIRLLSDEVVRVDGVLTLAGRNDAWRRSGRLPVADLLKDTPRDLPLIVLDHQPVDNDAISRAGADVQLSGHTHHGQLWPVNYVTAHRYELDWGYKLKGRTHVFVTCGVQLWGPQVRTTGVSEILVIDLDLR